jgi:hypothetical protein
MTTITHGIRDDRPLAHEKSQKVNSALQLLLGNCPARLSESLIL